MCVHLSLLQLEVLYKDQFCCGSRGFIIYAHDFKVVGLLNSALKYADDFTLIVPENTDVGLSAEDEIRNVLLWSDDNKLSVNLSKCKEIVFRRPSVKLDILHLIRWLILSVFLVQSYLAYSLTVD